MCSSDLPNETNLKITGLTTYHDLLQTKNNEVLNTLVPLSNARINRNRILYKETTGLTSVALDTKKYIKALFGATSSEYKQISKLSFRASK